MPKSTCARCTQIAIVPRTADDGSTVCTACYRRTKIRNYWIDQEREAGKRYPAGGRVKVEGLRAQSQIDVDREDPTRL